MVLFYYYNIYFIIDLDYWKSYVSFYLAGRDFMPDDHFLTFFSSHNQSLSRIRPLSGLQIKGAQLSLNFVTRTIDFLTLDKNRNYKSYIYKNYVYIVVYYVWINTN
jgi:hypothetical protein